MVHRHIEVAVVSTEVTEVPGFLSTLVKKKVLEHATHGQGNYSVNPLSEHNLCIRISYHRHLKTQR